MAGKGDLGRRRQRARSETTDSHPRSHNERNGDGELKHINNHEPEIDEEKIAVEKVLNDSEERKLKEDKHSANSRRGSIEDAVVLETKRKANGGGRTGECHRTHQGKEDKDDDLCEVEFLDQKKSVIQTASDDYDSQCNSYPVFVDDGAVNEWSNE